MIQKSITLGDVLRRYIESRFVADGTVEQYAIAVELFIEWNQKDPPIHSLTEEQVSGWLRHYHALPRSAATVRRKRGYLITLWRFAADREWHREPIVRRIPSPKRDKRIPSSWSPEEMTRILKSCESAVYPATWSPDMWVALTRTVYDTAHRVGCLTRVPMRDLDTASGILRVDAAHTKQSADTHHRLSPETLNAIEATRDLGREYLFPWVHRRNYLQRCFKRILKKSGLPHGRRDLFHKIRRTSYTQVAIQLGKAAAGDHAGHSTDMSEFYLDTTKLETVNAVDVLPAI